LCSVQDIFNMRRQIHILNALILLRSFLQGPCFISYNAILHTNALTMHNMSALNRHIIFPVIHARSCSFSLRNVFYCTKCHIALAIRCCKQSDGCIQLLKLGLYFTGAPRLAACVNIFADSAICTNHISDALNTDSKNTAVLHVTVLADIHSRLRNVNISTKVYV